MIVALTFLTLAIPVARCFSSASGFYVDNGLDQTVREKSVTLHDRQEIEHEILELLGLPDRPNKKHIHPSLRKSASQFLMNIYHKFSAEMAQEQEGKSGSRQKRSSVFSRSMFTIADERAIEESDVIMTFLNKGNRNMPKIRHRRYGERLWFDTSETENSDSGMLLYASLRVYKNSTIDQWNAITSGRLITVRTSIIREYDSSRSEHSLEFIAEHTVPYNYEGWLEINVTDAMVRWMASSISNKGIFVDAFYTESPSKNVRPQDLGLILSNKYGRYQPFMVGYCKGRELFKSTNHPSRAKRSVVKNSPRKNPKKSVRPKNPLLDRWSQKEKSCQIHTLYVSFRDLNWQDWIIAPDGFGAFFCHGECNFPLNTHMNATNHALIQTLVHLIHPASVPKPCCAPTKLNPISVLYHIDDANINLKKYRNMVVKSCGCL